MATHSARERWHKACFFRDVPLSRTNLVPRIPRVDVISDGVTWVLPAPIVFIGCAAVLWLTAMSLLDPLSFRTSLLDRQENDLVRAETAQTVQQQASLMEIEESLRLLRQEALLRGLAPEGELLPSACAGPAAVHAANHLREAARLSRALAAQAASQGVAVAAMLPSRSPIDFATSTGTAYVSSLEGMRADPFSGAEELHKGLDIAAGAGTPVLATADGQVLFAGAVEAALDHAASLLGSYVEIEHGKTGFRTLYGHLSRVDVKTGQAVRSGDRIGTVGSSGHSTAPHLHYQVMKGTAAVDPLAFITDVDLVRDGAVVRFSSGKRGK